MINSFAIPSSAGFTGSVPSAYASLGEVMAAAVLWLVVLFVLSILVFRKTAES